MSQELQEVRAGSAFVEAVSKMKRKYTKGYTALAYTTFNVVIALILTNVVLAGVYFVRDHFKAKADAVDSKAKAYHLRFADWEAYARISPAVARQYIDQQIEMASKGFQYEPWVQFRNPEYHGSLLNTDSDGFRKTKEPGRGGKPLRIFVLGGSTTFGYGVPDDYTIPSYMQSILETRHPNQSFLVRNFGQGYYYSSQEMLLLFSLIKKGDIPDYVIFIDGGNDATQLAPQRDEPWFTPTVRQLWDIKRGASAASINVDSSPSWIPMIRLARSLSAGLSSSPSNADLNEPSKRLIMSDTALSEEERKGIADYVVSRYTSNLRMVQSVCKDYGIQCLFVWQPYPGYKYDRSLHKNFPFKGPVPDYLIKVFSRMESYKSNDFLFLGSMLEDIHYKVFVDEVHYNEVLNEMIASRICDQLRVK